MHSVPKLRDDLSRLATRAWPEAHPELAARRIPDAISGPFQPHAVRHFHDRIDLRPFL
jgi:hypothetical protein